MPTLYRQYRPASFAEIVGQDQITATLKAALTTGRVSHAYLFQGPRGTGKTSTARIFAKRLNCTAAKDAEPCQTCPSCVALHTNRHMDVIEIDAASNRSIDDIKALREQAGIRPGAGKYKVYIIDEVHMLSHDAFGALLKILEEPPAHVIFILATTELHKVPATILSRCQLYRFRRATPAAMKQRLQYVLDKEQRHVDDELLNFIIQRSDGCYRDAESLLGQIVTVQEVAVSAQQAVELLGLPSMTIMNHLLTALVNADSKDAIAVIDQAYEAGLDPEQILKESIRVARDGAVAVAKGEANLPVFAQASNASVRLPIVIRSLLQALQDLAYVPQPIIALHLAVLTVCAPTSVQQPRAVAPVKTVTQPIQPIVTSEPLAAPKAGKFSLQDVQNIWAEVINTIKTSNPVSSTFLRATEPINVDGNRVTLRVQYSLHKNFFDKPEQKALVEQSLAQLLGQSVSIRCQFEEAPVAITGLIATTQTASLAQTPSPAPAPANDLYETVKEVFG